MVKLPGRAWPPQGSPQQPQGGSQRPSSAASTLYVHGRGNTESAVPPAILTAAGRGIFEPFRLWSLIYLTCVNCEGIVCAVRGAGGACTESSTLPKLPGWHFVRYIKTTRFGRVQQVLEGLCIADSLNQWGWERPLRSSPATEALQTWPQWSSVTDMGSGPLALGTAAPGLRKGCSCCPVELKSCHRDSCQESLPHIQNATELSAIHHFTSWLAASTLTPVWPDLLLFGGCFF